MMKVDNKTNFNITFLLTFLFHFLAHYGYNPGNHMDILFNDKEVAEAENLILLQVTATPYNLVTANSRYQS